MDNSPSTVTESLTLSKEMQNGILKKIPQMQGYEFKMPSEVKATRVPITWMIFQHRDVCQQQWRWSLAFRLLPLSLLPFSIPFRVSLSNDVFITVYSVLVAKVPYGVMWLLVMLFSIRALACIASSHSSPPRLSLIPSGFRQKPVGSSQSFSPPHVGMYSCYQSNGSSSTAHNVIRETSLYTIGSGGQTKVAIQKQEQPVPICNGFLCPFYAYNSEKYKACRRNCFRPGSRSPKPFSDWLRRTLENHWHWGDCLEEGISSETWLDACEAKVDGRSTRGRLMSLAERHEVTYHNVCKILFSGMVSPVGCRSSSDHKNESIPNRKYHEQCKQLPQRKNSEARPSLLTQQIQLQSQLQEYVEDQSNCNASSSHHVQHDRDCLQSLDSMKNKIRTISDLTDTIFDHKNCVQARHDINILTSKLIDLQLAFEIVKQNVVGHIRPSLVTEGSSQVNSNHHDKFASMQSVQSSRNSNLASRDFLPDLSAPQNVGDLPSTSRSIYYINQDQIRSAADPPYIPAMLGRDLNVSGTSDLDMTIHDNTSQHLQLPTLHARASSISSRASFVTAPEQPNLSAYSGTSTSPFLGAVNNQDNTVPDLDALQQMLNDEDFDYSMDGYPVPDAPFFDDYAEFDEQD